MLTVFMPLLTLSCLCLFFAGNENGQKSFVRDNRDTGDKGNAMNNDWGFRAVV
jgi:hypothetical protein